jgi:O-antigen ligase
MFTLLCGVGVESSLVMIQMFNQESVGGLWYFLGERTFSAHTIGISTIYVRGQEILRAYGSFPHPNVLAFYLFFALVYIFTLRKMVKSKWIFLGIFGVGIIGVTSLFLTFSRSIIILSVVLVGLGLLRLHAREKIIGLGLLIGVVSVILKVFSERFAYGGVFSEDISYRIEMLQMGGKIIKQHPIFGVGIQNYLYVQFPFYDRLSPIFLQPIHSIYMLVGMQVGIVGIIGVSLFVFLTGRSYHMLQQSATSQYIYNFILASRILSLSVLIVGLFDHYFLTLQQGQIVTTLLISFGWLPWKDPRDLV